MASVVATYLFRLVSVEGETLGSLESAVDWQPGDNVTATDDVQYRVRSVIPLERIAEFVDEPSNSVLEVEPLQGSGGRSR